MTGRLASLRSHLPRGGTLPDGIWHKRHLGIVVLLWVHAAVIPIYALIMNMSAAHTAGESMIVPIAATIATIPRFQRRTRTAAASLGLLTSSAILVHLSGGLIEMHFHFFIMVVVVALYQEWIPFLVAVGYVLVHHGVLGALDPRSVFNHPAALNDPWKWAAIHTLFIAGISVACLVSWRLNEAMFDDRKRAESRLRRESRIVQRLNEVGKILAAELDLQGVMERVTEAATELTSAAIGAFFYNVEDPSGSSYLLYTLSGAPREAFEGFPLPRKTALFGATFDGTGIVRIADVRRDPRYGQNPPFNGLPAGHLPVRSYLAVPVRSRAGTVFGGLFFGHPRPGKFSEDDERIAAGIASHAAVAIDNARLYESEKRVRERLGVLAEASRVLAASLDVGVILNDLSRIIAPRVADTCAIYLVNEQDEVETIAASANPSIMDSIGDMERLPEPGVEGPVMDVIRTGESRFFEDVDDELIGAIKDPSHSELVRKVAPTSAIIVAFRGRHQILGALAVGTVAASNRRLSTDDMSLAEELAQRAAVAVENARLYAAKRTVAETLQRSLMPDRLPEIPGIETAARYLPGGPGEEVGGDWYDVLVLPDGSLGLVMGDVVGHGVPAAALMGQLRNALRAFAFEGRGPSEVMARLNKMLHELGPAEAMGTVVFCVFDPDTGTLRLTNAGHPPPLVVGIDAIPTFVENGAGPPLGAMRRAVYPETITTLTPGATLLLYTDGLVEDRVTPLDEGLERLRQAALIQPESVDSLCEHILAQSLRGREIKDDVAVLAMRCLPLGTRIRLRLPSRPEILRPLRSTLRRWLSSNGASEDEIHDILVACGEACTNAMRHPAPSASDFELEAEIGDDVSIRVKDRGPWRQGAATHGGRGIAIIEELMDSVRVDTVGEGTTVEMRRSLASRSKTHSP